MCKHLLIFLSKKCIHNSSSSRNISNIIKSKIQFKKPTAIIVSELGYFNYSERPDAIMKKYRGGKIYNGKVEEILRVTGLTCKLPP